MKLQRFLIAIVCLACLALFASGQSLRISGSANAPEDQKADPKKEKELQQKALLMLDELIEEAQSFRLPENRVRILAFAGDMLWQHDEKRSRTLFGEAMKILAQLIHLPEDSPEALPENNRWQVYGWRQEIVQLVARHDPQLAIDFLAATRPTIIGQQGPYSTENESQLELMLAQQVAAKDPKRTLEIAKEKLATAKNPGVVYGALTALREKDIVSAQELTDAVVAKLRGESPLGFESASFVFNLLSLAPSPTVNGETSPADQSKHLITPAVARELIEKVIAVTQAELANGKQQTELNQRDWIVNLFDNLKSSMPYIEKYAPASLPAVKRMLPEATQMKDIQQRRWEELNELAQKGSVDLLIEAAAKASPEIKYNYFQRAAQLAREQGNSDRGRQIIKENVSDIGQQRQALWEIDEQAIWKSISEGKFDEARRLLPRLRNDYERANMLTQMATTAQSGGKKELAPQFLEEAWALVDGQVESNKQFNSQLQIAEAFTAVNPNRSFEIVESTLDVMNELFAAAAMIETFDQHGSFRQKEMILSAGGRASQYVMQYGQQVASLARINFSRGQSLINRFTRSEVRVLLRLNVLQQLLRTDGMNIIGKRSSQFISVH